MLALVIVLLPGLAACSQQYTPYRPPTYAVQVTPPLPLAKTTGTPAASNPLTCTNNLVLLQDSSLPSGTVVNAGQSLDKRWLIQNSGTCNWDETYLVKLVSGIDFGASTEQALYPARAGAEVTLQMSLTAPAEPGAYQSAWQAFDPQGEAFGDMLTLQVVVEPAQP